MYLQQLRELDCRHGHWPGQCDTFMLNNCFDIADATLNSWKDAHDAFAMRIEKPGDPRFISHGVHYAFTRLVVRAFKDEEDSSIKSFATNKFPSEAIAYALLVIWIERALTEGGRKLGETVRSKCQRYRTTYHPDWSETLPWVTYRNGTAGRHFASLSEAKTYLKGYGAEFGEAP